MTVKILMNKRSWKKRILENADSEIPWTFYFRQAFFFLQGKGRGRNVGTVSSIYIWREILMSPTGPKIEGKRCGLGGPELITPVSVSLRGLLKTA